MTVFHFNFSFNLLKTILDLFFEETGGQIWECKLMCIQGHTSSIFLRSDVSIKFKHLKTTSRHILQLTIDGFFFRKKTKKSKKKSTTKSSALWTSTFNIVNVKHKFFQKILILQPLLDIWKLRNDRLYLMWQIRYIVKQKYCMCVRVCKTAENSYLWRWRWCCSFIMSPSILFFIQKMTIVLLYKRMKMIW